MPHTVRSALANSDGCPTDLDLEIALALPARWRLLHRRNHTREDEGVRRQSDRPSGRPGSLPWPPRCIAARPGGSPPSSPASSWPRAAAPPPVGGGPPASALASDPTTTSSTASAARPRPWPPSSSACCEIRSIPGGRLLLALDDTPTKRYGPEVQGAGIHHNPTPGPAGSKFLYGHSWVVLSRIARHDHSRHDRPAAAGTALHPGQGPAEVARGDRLGLPHQAAVGRRDDHLGRVAGCRPGPKALGGRRWGLCQPGVPQAGQARPGSSWWPGCAGMRSCTTCRRCSSPARSGGRAARRSTARTA